jgi:hypothetical protein
MQTTAATRNNFVANAVALSAIIVTVATVRLTSSSISAI